jgi:hypothetical protein
VVPASVATARIGGWDRIFGFTIGIWVVAAALLLTRGAAATAVAGSFAIGWSHLAGRCGLSHFGTLTPRGKLPGQRTRWLADVLVYTSTGALASTTVGLALGLLGTLIPLGLRGGVLALVLILALVAGASDLGVIPWQLPQPSRQTRREWGAMFRPPIPAALWGLGLGLTVATVFTFSGTWLVLALPVAKGEPAFGAAMSLGHWLGRAAPIVAGPFLLPSATQTMHCLDDIERARTLFRASNLFGIALIAASLVMLMWR